MVWATQASIDGLRAIAERTKNYQGQDEPEYVENDDGPLLCRYGCGATGQPSVGVAYWSEYVQTTRDKQTGKTRPDRDDGRGMPHVMLAKVASRSRFGRRSEDMGGLYSTDEMAQALVRCPRRPPRPSSPCAAWSDRVPVAGDERSAPAIRAPPAPGPTARVRRARARPCA